MIDETLLESEDHMGRSVEHAREELMTIRTGRANPAMFNGVIAEYYGVPTPITQMATISVPEPRMLIIKPYERREAQDVAALREPPPDLVRGQRHGDGHEGVPGVGGHQGGEDEGPEDDPDADGLLEVPSGAVAGRGDPRIPPGVGRSRGPAAVRRSARFRHSTCSRQ